MKILLVRNDKIGDFMLSWPAIAMLKSSLPQAEIFVMVPAYTAPLAELNPNISGIIVDPGKAAPWSEQVKLLKAIRNEQFDLLITLYSTQRTALLGLLAGIPYRLAPATKLAQFLYNDRVVQRRSRSAKPEFEYNLDLARHLIDRYGFTPKEVAPPFLQFTPDTLSSIRAELGQAAPDSKKWVMVHTGCGGSANNLSGQQYQTLIEKLSQCEPDWHFILTAGPGEENATGQITQALQEKGVSCQSYLSNSGLTRFCQVIACADLFIAGSTGPLHIAGALNIPTAGFYPIKRSATPLRWQTLSEARLAFTPPDTPETQEEMSLIDLDQAVSTICRTFGSK